VVHAEARAAVSGAPMTCRGGRPLCVLQCGDSSAAVSGVGQIRASEWHQANLSSFLYSRMSPG
jgi:hypothetical protein